MSLYVFDPDALHVLGRLEGDAWHARQRAILLRSGGEPPRTGAAAANYCTSFAAFLDTWRALAEAGELPWPDAISPRLIDVAGDGMIYGEDGVARYVVRGDGEVVLLRWSTRPTKVALAEEIGVTVSKV